MILAQRLFILAIVFSFLGACSQSEPSTSKEETVFFDIKGYFAEQAKLLNNEQVGVRKMVKIGDSEEVHEMDSLNYEEELKLFANADINRPSWQSKYSVDSSFTQRKLSELHYAAQDDELKTREIRIQFKEEVVSAIEIINHTESTIAETNQRLSYIPNSGYSIRNEQKLIASPQKIVMIDVRFQREAQ